MCFLEHHMSLGAVQYCCSKKPEDVRTSQQASSQEAPVHLSNLDEGTSMKELIIQIEAMDQARKQKHAKADQLAADSPPPPPTPHPPLR